MLRVGSGRGLGGQEDRRMSGEMGESDGWAGGARWARREPPEGVRWRSELRERANVSGDGSQMMCDFYSRCLLEEDVARLLSFLFPLPDFPRLT